MEKRRTNQEWQMLIKQSESSSLSTLAFCKLNELNPSTFYAKRQQLNKTDVSLGFVRAEVVEKTTKYQAQIATANMTLLVNDVELSIPQGTRRTYRSAVMKRMLSAPEIYLYRESVDFRKSINGLAAIIESDTDLPLGSGALFLFSNKQRDKIKVLY
ncbi:TPA: IS66 family insertion sequence element accessory protein TnpB [Vibrio vulnificus]|nr:transposase [Vibrio vulnificus]HDY7743819.1 IS66 family insertion sequence element accessory protein TnpB [Vibrio vulnificus]HDY7780585.1 IS66 family insertion sequence element accessory protein TnpB [Vibrio vulnificus]HDY8108361.1 IS66 family insertion sequence element accessory protein TnpB [Vibrio vulnificus]HDZ3714426.1 IS66 family insertion sequence element accessory protein TnpB [Vibrio vulnificus]